MTTAINNKKVLCDLVRQHQVCWEVLPEVIVTDSHLVQIGYQVELAGIVNEHTIPGHSGRREVYSALHKIADWVVSENKHMSARFEIQPFESSVQYSALRHCRPDVILKLKILHRCGLDPVDECEQDCLKAIQERLASLGVHRGCWETHPNHPAMKYMEDHRRLKASEPRPVRLHGNGANTVMDE